MPNTPEISSIRQKLCSMMRASEMSEEDFQSLALDVFRYQFSKNIPYQNYCKSIGFSNDQVQHWKDIPLLSTDAFKLHDFPLTTEDPSCAANVFHTSGTTFEVKGKHYFPTSEIYDISILEAWKQLSLPSPSSLLILTTHPEDAPNSSLSHMMSVLADSYPDADIIWAMTKDGNMDFEKITQAVHEKPVGILGTAIAFLHLFENLKLPLPKGSYAMETGGYKGTKRRMEKESLYELFEQHLGLPAESVINEYSMTELSSQFYTRGLGKPHFGPPWVRTRVIDPYTGKDAKEGQPGHLAIYDLANIHSVCALQTQDLAIANGDRSFTLLGRDPSALPRGCSRAADFALS